MENTELVHRQLRRRWFYLLPAVFVTYSLAYLDRANYGFGAAAGLAKTLNISNSRSAFLGSLFFLGYFLFQVPGAAYARRRSVTRLVFYSLIAWGLLAALTGVIREFWLLALDRLLLGVAESLIFPAMLILLTNWFSRAERSRANTILILGNPITVLWMSAATGYLIKAVGWQMAFVIEGLPSVVWAFVWLLVARDRPEQVSWLSPDSCSQLTRELALEQRAIPLTSNLGAALRKPSVLLLCLQFFCWSVGLYGFVLWLPTIIHAGMSQGIETVGLLSAVPYLLAIILMLVVSYASDRTLSRKRFVWPFLVLSGIALLGSYLTAAHSFWWAYGFLILAGGCMYAPYGPFWAIIPETLPRNVVGEVLALVNCCGALGAFVGSWVVGLLQALTGNSRAGFLLMSISLILSGGIILFLRPLNQKLRSMPGN
ncbi:MFS transporter [Acidisarcina polymorpha]|uniref:MFS transporter n=1 Tax=Acidisarcina polymorpha TaxID=2211140 RepID=UPI001F3D96A5|nr:MFS transporter [Acidisarcina polymorpha]